MRIRTLSTAVIEATHDSTMVRIESGDGHAGWGEACSAPGLPGVAAELGELLIGADLRQVQPLVRRLCAEASTGGVVCNAVSGLDAALWDLNARMLGVPRWQLFGGRVHERAHQGHRRCPHVRGTAGTEGKCGTGCRKVHSGSAGLGSRTTVHSIFDTLLIQPSPNRAVRNQDAARWRSRNDRRYEQR